MWFKTQIAIDPFEPVTNDLYQQLAWLRTKLGTGFPVFVDADRDTEVELQNVYFHLPEDPERDYRHFLHRYEFGPCNTPDPLTIRPL